MKQFLAKLNQDLTTVNRKHMTPHLLESLQKEFQDNLKNVQEMESLLVLEQAFFSRKSGKLTELMKQLKDLSVEEKKEFGAAVNVLKGELEDLLQKKRDEIGTKVLGQVAKTEAIDITQPLLAHRPMGYIHPVTQVRDALEDVARSMGFLVEDGPELESDYYNFTAINMPPHHPARDSQDTFYIQGHPNWCMRTQTSNMQVRTLQKYGPPMRAIFPGRCFRNEATDARHEHTFYQCEGLVVDKGINLSHMIGVLRALLEGLYQKKLELRLRPKFYPFVEPGVNGEITCVLCDGNGCRVCKQTGWLEIFGAGMVHPNVLREAGVDPEVYSGFAFGMGLTRLVMLKYGIEDIRHLQSGDLRFLSQF